MGLNFLGLRSEDCAPENSRYHILPVPYDGTSTWNKGADKGPAALIGREYFGDQGRHQGLHHNRSATLKPSETDQPAHTRRKAAEQ